MNNYILPTFYDSLTLNLMKADIKGLPLITGSMAYYQLGKAMDNHGMALSNSSWNICSTITGTCTGILWGEKITTNQMIGISLGVLSLYLMNK